MGKVIPIGRARRFRHAGVLDWLRREQPVPFPVLLAACGFAVVNDLIRAGLLRALHDGRWVSLR